MDHIQRDWASSLQPEDTLIASMLYRVGLPIETVAACFQVGVAAVEASLYAEHPPKTCTVPLGKAYRGCCGCITFAHDERTAWHRLFADHADQVPPGYNPEEEWTVEPALELDRYWDLQSQATPAMYFAMGRDTDCPVCNRTMHLASTSPTDLIQIGGLGTPVVPNPLLGSKAPNSRRERRERRGLPTPVQPLEAVWGVQEVVCKTCWPSYARLLPGLTAIRRRKLADYLAHGDVEDAVHLRTEA